MSAAANDHRDQPMSARLGDPGISIGVGTRYIVRQQLYTNHHDFTVFDATGTTVWSAHGNDHGTTESIELRDAAGTAVLEVTRSSGDPPAAEIRSNGGSFGTLINNIAFTNDTHLILTPIVPSPVFAMTLDPTELADIARSRMTRGLTQEECATYDIDPCPTLEDIQSGRP